MSDDLVKRLRWADFGTETSERNLMISAAGRIETQAARIAELEVAALQKRVRKLEYLVQCLLDEDPNDLAADGGVTVLDVWRKEARAALEGGKDE